MCSSPAINSNSGLFLAVVVGTVFAGYLLFCFFAFVLVFCGIMDSTTQIIRVRKAAIALSSAPLNCNCNLANFVVPRKDIMDALDAAFDCFIRDTVLVYGERGSGKTTAIEWYLRNRFSGVVQLRVGSKEGPSINEELEEKWTKLFGPWIFRPWVFPWNSKSFWEEVLKYIEESGRNPLVVILSMEADPGPQVMESVICFRRSLTFGHHVQTIIELSSSSIPVPIEDYFRFSSVQLIQIKPLLYNPSSIYWWRTHCPERNV